jgi:catalase-peroxidase
MGEDFNYAEEFAQLDYAALKKDLYALMTDSQDGGRPITATMAGCSSAWPAQRGTYRMGDGRGGAGTGNQRFAPLNSWPDNANLDKARRLLWPIKQKYGKKISWADLMILAGNCALESMGFKTFGSAAGAWTSGSRKRTSIGIGSRVAGRQALLRRPRPRKPAGRRADGLIYVNPEGPNGVPDAVASARDVRDLRAHGDERRGDRGARRRAGTRLARRTAPARHPRGPRAGAAPVEEMGLGWKSSFGTGKGDDTITSGIEGPWTPNPIQWDMGYFDMLFNYDWNLVKSPAGAWQWVPVGVDESHMAPVRARFLQARPTIMTTRRPCPADGSGVSQDRQALPRTPGGVCGRLRPRVVQADSPRHGTARALSRPGSSCRGVDLARPGARRGSPAD